MDLSNDCWGLQSSAAVGKDGNEKKSDVKSISAKLQSLLQIPSTDVDKEQPQSGSKDGQVLKPFTETRQTPAQRVVAMNPVSGGTKVNTSYGPFLLRENANPGSDRPQVTKKISQIEERVKASHICVHANHNKNEVIKNEDKCQMNSATGNSGQANSRVMPSMVSSGAQKSNVQTNGSGGGLIPPANLRGKCEQRLWNSYAQICEKELCPVDVRNNIAGFVRASILCDTSGMAMIQYCGALDEGTKSILREHFIIFLNKKSLRFPRARFLCRACNYHMDSVYSAVNHIIQERHFYQEKTKKIEYLGSNIPPASREQVDALSHLMESVSSNYGLTAGDQLKRFSVLVKFKEALKSRGLDCTVSLFGSSVSGFGFRDSNLNLNVTWESDSTTSEAQSSSVGRDSSVLDVSKIVRVLEVCPEFHNVVDGNTLKKPFISFEMKDIPNISCRVHFNNHSGVWLALLFDEYNKLDSRVKKIVIAFRHFAKLSGIDNQENGFLPSHCYTILVIHFFQELGILPVLHQFPAADTSRPFSTAKELHAGGWRCKNNSNVGQLWLDMLNYYTTKFDYKNRVCTISRGEVLLRTDKYWNRPLSIEDPMVINSNISRSTSSGKVCDYIIERIKVAYKYFAIPRNEDGALYDGIAEEEFMFHKSPFMKTIVSYDGGFKENDGQQTRKIKYFDSRMKSDPPEVPADATLQRVQMLNQYSHTGELESYVIPNNAGLLHEFLRKDEYRYEFNKDIFWDNTPPPLVCKSCSTEGHTRANCPEETIPPVVSVSKPSAMSLENLQFVIERSYAVDYLREDDREIRVRIAEELQALLEPLFPDIKLTLFGSSQSGFGLRNSDVDICMMFHSLKYTDGESPLSQINVQEVLMKVVNALKQSGRMADVLPITSAKVPIVKFRHKESRLDGDISLYNMLPLRNTALLRAYTKIDRRVEILGCFLKKLTKMCDISDASKGSLSSYGYILMLIYFLQHYERPLLPVLQEFYPAGVPKSALPQIMVDGCNTYFFEEFQLLPSHLKPFSKSTESVESIWLAFLNFYTETFNFEDSVVCISQFEPLTKKAKGWNTDSIAIADPFDSSHNLGAGLSRRMSVHIVKAFQRLREIFHKDSSGMTGRLAFQSYLDVTKIRGGNPPIDRQCRLCNRIGHFARNCTYGNKGDVDNDNLAVEDVVANSHDMPSQLPLKVVELNPTQEMNRSEKPSNHPVKITPPPPPKEYQSIREAPVADIPDAEREISVGDLWEKKCIPVANVSNPYGHSVIQPNTMASANMPPVLTSGYAYSPVNTSVLPDFCFFWNLGQIKSNEDLNLVNMVKQSSGVEFSDYLQKKTERIRNKLGLIIDIPKPRVPVNQLLHEVPRQFMGGGLSNGGYVYAPQMQNFRPSFPTPAIPSMGHTHTGPLMGVHMYKLEQHQGQPGVTMSYVQYQPGGIPAPTNSEEPKMSPSLNAAQPQTQKQGRQIHTSKSNAVQPPPGFAPLNNSAPVVFQGHFPASFQTNPMSELISTLQHKTSLLRVKKSLEIGLEKSESASTGQSNPDSVRQRNFNDSPNGNLALPMSVPTTPSRSNMNAQAFKHHSGALNTPTQPSYNSLGMSPNPNAVTGISGKGLNAVAGNAQPYYYLGSGDYHQNSLSGSVVSQVYQGPMVSAYPMNSYPPQLQHYPTNYSEQFAYANPIQGPQNSPGFSPNKNFYYGQQPPVMGLPDSSQRRSSYGNVCPAPAQVIDPRTAIQPPYYGSAASSPVVIVSNFSTPPRYDTEADYRAASGRNMQGQAGYYPSS